MASTIQFSQASLQDYVDCPRKYQLRHVLAQPWPRQLAAFPAEAELSLQRGAGFHRLVHQWYAGVTNEQLMPTLEHDPVLRRWWETYQRCPPPGLPSALLRPEAVLSSPMGGHRLVARLDLLAVEPGSRAVIVDWKTALARPGRAQLAQRLQTRVYLYLLVAAAQAMGIHPELRAEQAEMVYWFCELDGATERFIYSAEQFAADGVYLTALTAEIAGRGDGLWPLTPDEGVCGRCSYCSLCERRAGLSAEREEAEDALESADIDLEQIAEVIY